MHLPAASARFREQLRGCGAALFVTPEYNRSVPGVLKNAIDVGSRPSGKRVWDKKPAAIISVSPGSVGAFGANHHLRQSLVFLNMPTLQQPEAYVGHADALFDASGQLAAPTPDAEQEQKRVADRMHHRRAGVRMSVHRGVLVGLILQSFLAVPASAQASLPGPDVVLGVRVTVGGRYDNVRRCVATSRGTPGGPAADIQFFVEFALRPDLALTVNLPVMRPILFAAAFKVLQFEPDVTLSWRRPASDRVDWIVGPSLGLSLHYGPDYTSELSGPKFFAMGPTFGGYFGLDFKQTGVFNFQLGLHPYITPLFGVSDPAGHQGVVVGAMLEGPFRFALQR